MTDRRNLLLLAVLHLVMVALVQPRGEFPLNDDWAYAHSVQWLLAEGRIRLSDWIAMNLLPQTLLGAAAAAIAGFSFELLRHVTQAVALATLWIAYGWFRQASLDSVQALVATFVLAACPAWPVLANSYMTDLYGLALALGGAWALLRALESGSRPALLAGAVLCALGVLQRQVVLVVPFAFAVAWLLRDPRRGWRGVAIGLAPLALAFACEAAYQAYLRNGPGVPLAQQYAHGRVLPLIGQALRNERRHGEVVLLNIASVAGYLGLFTAGWAAWRGFQGEAARVRRVVLAGAVVLAAFALAWPWLPPYRPGQVMDAAGIGPFVLYDGLSETVSLDRSPGWIWPAAGVAAMFGLASLAGLAVVASAKAWRERRTDPGMVFLVAVLVAYLGPFVVTDYIDRYLLFSLPFVLALWHRTWPGAPRRMAGRAVGVACIALALAVSTVATRDYFSWNRARWDAITAARALGADASNLDGGFEYNGYEGYERFSHRAAPGRSWYWVQDDRFVVAFAPVAGYDVVRRFPVRRWLARTPAEIVLLRRAP
jgi:hypothetical protein